MGFTGRVKKDPPLGRKSGRPLGMIGPDLLEGDYIGVLRDPADDLLNGN